MTINGILYIWPDFIKICNALVCGSFLLQLLMRFIGRLLHDDEQAVLDIQAIINDFYIKEEKNPERRKLLINRITSIEFLMKAYMLINGILFNIPIATSLAMSIYFRDLIPIAPIYMLFLDPEDLSGFIVNEFFMLFFSFMLFMLLIAVDITCLYYILQIIPMSDVLIMNMKELGDAIKIQPKQHHDEIRNKLIDIIKEFRKYNKYISLLVNYMHFPIFSVISTNALAIACSLLIAKFLSVLVGFSFGIILVLQVLLPCIEGAIISHQNNEIQNAVWKFPWIDLPHDLEKIWLQFMHQCQSANEFRIMLVGVLNMECFTNVINASYSSWILLMKIFQRN